MTVYKVSDGQGHSHFTNDQASIPAGASFTEVEMTEQEYFAIPATADATAFFCQSKIENRESKILP